MNDSPFKMLDSYKENDYDHFFGREKETAQLYNAVFASNLTLLYGASGTGKTSLIDCGLRNSFYETDWLPVFIRRGNDINKSLENALHLESKRYKKDKKEALASLSVRERVAILYRDYFRPVYLIFDQFEELFISGREDEQVQFYQTIMALLESGLQAKVILIFREEWIAYLHDFERYVPALFDNRLRIEKMTQVQLLEVIEGTIDYAKIEVKENPIAADSSASVSEAVLENLRGKSKEIELANLQIYLDRLYRNDLKRMKKEGDSRPVRFDHTLVNQTQGIEDVLSDFLEEQVAIMELELKTRKLVTQKGVPMNILYGLVTDDGTKRSLSVDKLKEDLLGDKGQTLSAEVIDYCIDRFHEMRIIRILSKD